MICFATQEIRLINAGIVIGVENVLTKPLSSRCPGRQATQGPPLAHLTAPTLRSGKVSPGAGGHSGGGQRIKITVSRVRFLLPLP